jgi:hypothetical protein
MIMAKSTRTKLAAAAAHGPRKIAGNLPYLPGPGSLKKALDGIVGAQRPDKFNADFLESILNLKGGATVPIFKKMGLVASDGSPTELYSRFKTDSGRGSAALQAIKNAIRKSISAANMRTVLRMRRSKISSSKLLAFREPTR